MYDLKPLTRDSQFTDDHAFAGLCIYLGYRCIRCAIVKNAQRPTGTTVWEFLVPQFDWNDLVKEWATIEVPVTNAKLYAQAIGQALGLRTRARGADWVDQKHFNFDTMDKLRQI